MTAGRQTISVCDQPPRLTQPGRLRGTVTVGQLGLSSHKMAMVNVDTIDVGLAVY